MICALFALFCCLFIYCEATFDLTLVKGSNGTDVVDACLAKLSNAYPILPYDEQLLRRIAYAETQDGNTYSGTNNNGGIWQLSSSKYQQTKTVLESTGILSEVSISFGIDWSGTIASDLQKPFYSALGARLYMEVLKNTTAIPLSIDASQQANYYASYYTSTGGSTGDFQTAIDAVDNIEVCVVDSLDIVFLLDFSSSVGEESFQTMLMLVSNITNTFNIGEDGVRVGVITYSNEAEHLIPLNDHYSKSALLSAISSISYVADQFTRISSALVAARTTAFTEANGARPISQGVPRVAVLITDGKTEMKQQLIEEADNLHAAGIMGFAVGVGEARQEEIDEVASRPSYSTYIDMFQSLDFVNLHVKLSKEICVASPDLNIDEIVNDTIAAGEIKYLNYPLPSDGSGITIKLSISSGYCVLYASSLIRTPNEALYDLKLTTRGWADGFIDQNTLANAETASKIFIVIRSIEVTTISLSAGNGDTSTVPVSITINPSTTLVGFRGSQVTAIAYAIGRPTATVRWYRPDRSLLTSGSNSQDITIINQNINATAVSSELSISNLNAGFHTGLYRCYGFNILPDGSRAEFDISLNLTVREFMAINFVGGVISSTAISLSWEVPTVPGVNIIIQYFRIDIEEVETSREWSITTMGTSAVVMSLHAYYTYNCRLFTVSNITYRTDTVVTLLTHQAAPSLPPGSISGIIITSTSLNLTWTPPPLDGRNGIIQRYEIRMTELATNTHFEYTSQATFQIIIALRPYYLYTFQIAAFTTAIGPFSTNYSIRMPEDVPSGKPSNFSAIITTYTTTTITITFSWFTPPTDQINGIILHYRFTCSGVTINEIDLNVTDTSITIESLQLKTLYTCSVCAYTRIGCGPNAIIFIFTNQPGSIITTTTATTIRLEWSSPFRNNEVVQYRILYQIIETTFQITVPNAIVVIDTGSTEVEYLIELLLPGTTYRIEVIAVLIDGTEQAIGNEVTAKTKDRDDYTVRGYQCILASSDSISCSWNSPLPLPNGFVIKEYQIAYRFADGYDYLPGFGSELSRTTLSSTTTQYTISELRVYTGYVIELRCIMTSTGNSDITSIITVISNTPADFANGTIQDFMILVNSSQIIWKPPPRINWNGNIISYNIVYERRLVDSSGGEYSFSQNIVVTPVANNPDPSLATDPLKWERYGVSERFEENFEYKFIFVIINSKGAGPPYEITVPIKESVPTGPPINIRAESVTRTSMVIVWSPPNPINANGVIVLYSITIVRVRLQVTLTAELPASQTSFPLEGLLSFENISVTIAARTAVGWGPYSEIKYFTTLGNSPGVPLNLVGTFASNTSVLLKWNTPSITNGVILGYQIIYAGYENIQNITTPETGPFTLTTARTEILITRLFVGYYYMFQVRARNIDGYGQSSMLGMVVPGFTNMFPGGQTGNAQDDNTELIFLILLAILCAILLCIILICCLICCWKYCCKKSESYVVPPINGSIDSVCLKTLTLDSSDFYDHCKVSGSGGGTGDKVDLVTDDQCPCEQLDSTPHHETTFIYEKCDSSRSSPNIAIDEVHIHTNGPAQLPHPDQECECINSSPSESIIISADIDGGFHDYHEGDNILINTGETDIHIHTGVGGGTMTSADKYPYGNSPEPPVIITTMSDNCDWSPDHHHDVVTECPSPTRERSPCSPNRSGPASSKTMSLTRNTRPMKVSVENVALGTTRRAQTLQAPRSNYSFSRSSETLIGRSHSLRDRPMYSVTRISSSDNLKNSTQPGTLPGRVTGTLSGRVTPGRVTGTLPGRVTASVISGNAPSPTQARRVRVQEGFELNSLTLSNRGGMIELEPRRAHSMRSPGPKRYGRSQYV